MASINTLNNNQNLKEEIMLEIVKTYGNRLNLKSINKENEKFILSFDYTRPFQIFDETEKKIYLRAIKIKNLYSLEINTLKNISLPINEINESIKSYFDMLQQEISKEVLLNKDLIIKLLDTNHTFSQILNKLSKLVNRLIEDSYISKEYKNNLVKFDSINKEYFKLLESSDLITQKDDGYYTTPKFNKILDESKTQDSIRYSKNLMLYNVLIENYDYMVEELKLNVLKSYINMISVFVYLEKHQGLGSINLTFKGLYETYVTLFRKKEDKEFFKDRINELKENTILNTNLTLNSSYNCIC